MNVVKAPTQDLEAAMRAVGRAARAAADALALADARANNRALIAMAAEIRRRSADIIAANAQDMADAKAKGLTDALLDRLMLNDKRIEAMATGLEEIANLPDPVGKTLAEWERPN